MYREKLQLVLCIMITIFLLIAFSSAWYRREVVEEEPHQNKKGHTSTHIHKGDGDK